MYVCKCFSALSPFVFRSTAIHATFYFFTNSKHAIAIFVVTLPLQPNPGHLHQDEEERIPYGKFRKTRRLKCKVLPLPVL